MSSATLPGSLTIGPTLALGSGNTLLYSSATDTLSAAVQPGFVAGTYNGVTYNSAGIATGVVSGTPSSLIGYTNNSNTSLGVSAAASTGSNNILIGYNAQIGAAATGSTILGANTSAGVGVDNVVIGRAATVTSGANGRWNVLIGSISTCGNAGGGNTCIGYGANVNHGSTAMGYFACNGSTNCTGTYIGVSCMATLGATNFNSNTICGEYSTATATASNCAVIGGSNSLSADRSIFLGRENIGGNATHSNTLCLGHQITTVAANAIHVGSVAFPYTTTTSATAGGATALPVTPAGYLTVVINGTSRKMAYY